MNHTTKKSKLQKVKYDTFHVNMNTYNSFYRVLSICIINAHKNLEGHTHMHAQDYTGEKSRQGRRGDRHEG